MIAFLKMMLWALGSPWEMEWHRGNLTADEWAAVKAARPKLCGGEID